MSFTIDTRKTSNDVAINVKLPDNKTSNDVLLDFTSLYDRSEFNRILQVKQLGNWIIGKLPNDRVPPVSGFYKVEIHDSVADHLALKDIHLPLKDIMVALKDIVGPSRDALIATLEAQIFAGDLPATTERITTTEIVTEYTRSTDTEAPVEYTRNDDNASATTYRR